MEAASGEVVTDSKQAPTKETRPASTVPLANPNVATSTVPVDEQDLEQWYPAPVQGEPSKINQRQVSQYASPPPPVIRVEPTKLEQAYTMAHRAAEALKNRSANKITVSASESARLRKQLEKDTNDEPAVVEQKITNARLLTGYKTAYEGKINHNFKRDYYDVDRFTLNAQQTEIQVIRDLLNSTHVPDTLEMCIVKGAEIVELIAQQYLQDCMHDFSRRVHSAVLRGELQAEIVQLSVEWSSWFAQQPGQRLAFKLGTIATGTLVSNSHTLQFMMKPRAPPMGAGPGAVPEPVVPADVVKRTNDL